MDLLKKSDDKKPADYWRIIFVASMIGIVPTLGKLISELLPFQVNGTLIAAVCGAAGALIGYGIYSLVQEKKVYVKVIALVAMLVVMFAGVFVCAKFASDDHVATKEWKTVKNGNMSFQYPREFSEMKIDEIPENADMKMYTDNSQERLVMNLIIDFKSDAPKPEDSLSGSMYNSLNSLKATDIEFVDSQFYDDAVTTKVTYKIDNKERLGFGIIYFNENHYEIAFFMPYTRNYSDSFLNKVIDSISVE